MLKTLRSTDGSHIASFTDSRLQGMASSQYGSDDLSISDFLFPGQRDPPSRFEPFNTGINFPFRPLSLQTLDLCHLSTPDVAMTSSSSSKPYPWASANTTTTSPSHLFQAGFQDCATEVIQFLRNQEKMDSENPLLQGLSSHLMGLSQSLSDAETHSLNLIDSPITSHGPQSPLLTSSPLSVRSSSSSMGLSTLSERNPEKFSSHVKSCKRKRSSDSGLFISPSCSSLLPDEDINSPVPSKRSCHRNQIPTLSYLANQAALYSVLTTERKRHVSIPVPELKGSLSQTEALNNSPVISTVAVIKTINNPIFSYHPLESISAPALIPVQLSNFNADEKVSSLPSLSAPPQELSVDRFVSHVNDISSLTADNDDDVLQSVELCQSHEDPRVRHLASKIINLIQDIDDDEGDEHGDDVDTDSECEENNRHELEDSGIDLEED